MFGTLGGQELLLILVLALIVFGPRKLPEIGKGIGRMMAELRRASNDFKRTIEDEVESEKGQTRLPAGSEPGPGTGAGAPADASTATAPPDVTPARPDAAPDSPPGPDAGAVPRETAPAAGAK